MKNYVYQLRDVLDFCESYIQCELLHILIVEHFTETWSSGYVEVQPTVQPTVETPKKAAKKRTPSKKLKAVK